MRVFSEQPDGFNGMVKIGGTIFIMGANGLIGYAVV